MSNLIDITLKEAVEELTANFRAKTVPLLLGQPGTGKSAVVHQVAEMFKLKLIDLRLTSCLPEDLQGFGAKVEVTNADGSKTTKATYIPFDTFPLETDTVPEGYRGWLLFLDEFTSTPKGVQAPSYKLVLDREVGGHKLHPKVAIACAGNRAEDKAITVALSTALKTRVITYHVELPYEDWLEWAAQNNIDQRILAYIGFRKGTGLNNFDPDRDAATYACPRTWEFLSKLIKGTDVSFKLNARVSGAVGPEAAADFITFCREFDKIPRLKDIIDSPKHVPIPDNSATQYAIATAVAGMLSEGYEKDNKILAPILEFILRFDPEYNVMFSRMVLNQNMKMRTVPAFSQYAIRFVQSFT